MANKVQVQMRNGPVKEMEERYAKILVGLGRATYLTRDMQNAPNKVQPQLTHAPAPQNAPPPADDLIGDLRESLDGKDKDQLHEIAKREGVELHPLTGADKARKAIEAKRAEGK